MKKDINIHKAVDISDITRPTIHKVTEAEKTEMNETINTLFDLFKTSHS